MPLSSTDLQILSIAKEQLENPSAIIMLSHRLGTPIEKGFEALPENWRIKIEETTRKALMASLKSALYTMNNASAHIAFSGWHTLAATVSGGVGGVFGLPGLLIELPVSTTIILRSIADIGRSMGENLSSPEAQLACLEVFALGGLSKNDDAAESGYFATRGALMQAAKEASHYLTKNKLIEESAPAMVKFIAKIAIRFQIQVSEKVAAMAIPAISAIGGSAINYIFIEHFQKMSRGHFTVRKLEREYGIDMVRETYEAIILPKLVS